MIDEKPILPIVVMTGGKLSNQTPSVKSRLNGSGYSSAH